MKYASVVKRNEGKVMVKCECISSCHYVFHYCYCLTYSMLIVININLYVVVVIVFALYSLCVVCPLLCIFVCCVSFERGLSFCVIVLFVCCVLL
jgi:hypothetical protein